jgi:hypothetical protein
MAKKNIEKELPVNRYAFTMEHLIKHNEIYVLQEADNKLAISSMNDKKLLSFWPTKEIALKNAKGCWDGYSAKMLTIEDMEVMLDVIEDNDWEIDIFPKDSKTGVVLSVEEFVENLNKTYQAVNS